MTQSRPLRVLSALHSLEPGGVERDVLRFTKGWRDAGVDARIALGRREGRLEEEAPDVPYIIPKKGRLARIETESLWMMLRLPAIVRQERPDVLFFASNGLMAVAAVTKLRLGRDCPPIVLRTSNSLRPPHWSALHHRLHRALLRLHGRIYAAIVAMAPPLRDEIIEEMGVSPQAVTVINNGALARDTAERLATLRDATPRDHAGRHFLAVGRLSPQKNFALLLEAFARIARPDDRLTIVGEGPLREALTRQAQDLGIAGQLELPGHCHPVDPWFARADAFILSSDFEGLPAVLVEALAAGLPIVATDCAVTIPSMIEGAGRLVPVRDATALAAAMDAIGDDPVDVPAMRARAARFTLEATIDQWIGLFRKVARK
ncbi:putative glycosyltransferase [Sphingobium sp. SYK-6]|uniref:glycosyltransferase n=1 Tax=Sphingobium sp. (strain NBRC 103272 / SYK-6) TaxID=627192 RepID=UPI0002276C68|nr:glycosyltransferase [Sphingobium sp. SYK-6]BAK65546.1 putative glycosyltransferase [Sphingobium sp. SYK-6]